jgi:hypothetical protein
MIRLCLLYQIWDHNKVKATQHSGTWLSTHRAFVTVVAKGVIGARPASPAVDMFLLFVIKRSQVICMYYKHPCSDKLMHV